MALTIPIPGVPMLPPTAATPVIVAIGAEVLAALIWKAALVPPAWGVFDQEGNQVLFPDSVLEFANRQEYEISNYPVQGGSFASYNKVIRPFDIQLRFSKGGTESERDQFLQSIDDLAASLELVDVYTPERVYQDVNLDRYEVVRRGAKGAYFLTEIDCYFTHVIQTQAQYTTTAVQLPNSSVPSAQPTSNVGTVQPTAPSSSLAQQGSNALASTPAGFG